MTVHLLAGLRVLELGDSVAGASATSILAALGADVTTVVDGSSPHRAGRPRAVRGGADVSLLAACLDRDKARIAIDDIDALAALVRDFDLVVLDRVHGGRGPFATMADPVDVVAFVGANNRGAWVTISAFGLSGPRAADVGTELTVSAAGGMLSAVRDERTGQPLKLGGQQSLLNTGQAAALAACHAVDLAADGTPVHLDLSAVEATIAMGPVLEVGGVLLDTRSLGGAKRYGSPADFYPCTDGLVRVSAMEDHQWHGVVTAMGSPEWAQQFATVESRIEGAAEIDDRVAAWTAGRTKREAETELQAQGVPATAVYSPAELLDSPQLRHRGAFEPMALDAGTAEVVGLPFRVVAGGAGERRRRSLRGLRMLEASRVLAVPLCGALLGALGADVTKLEDLPRLDMYRRRGPFVDGEPGPERGAYFALMNHSKASAGFDVDADRARLAELVGASDVVIENLGPKRADALGLSASAAPLSHPDVLAVSSSGFGQDGPQAEYRAYAYNLQASGALGYLTRNVDGDAAEIDIAWADLISAYALATIIAAWAVGPDGNTGAGVDFSMTDLVVSHFNEYVAAASLDRGADDADRGNELAPYAPHGVFRTADGWVAVAVEHDEQLAAVATALRIDAPPRGERFERRGELDAWLAAGVAERGAAEAADALRAVGVSAEAVLDAAALVADEQLTARGFFAPVEHPEWGRRRLVGLPWRPVGQPPPALGAPPLLLVARPAAKT